MHAMKFHRSIPSSTAARAVAAITLAMTGAILSASLGNGAPRGEPVFDLQWSSTDPGQLAAGGAYSLHGTIESKPASAVTEGGTFALAGGFVAGFTTGGGDACPADFDHDGAVAGADLATVLAAWGPCAPGGGCAADLDGSSHVDGADLAAVLAAWGPCPNE